MMTKQKPVDFNKRFDIVGCIIEHDGAFLMLRRHEHKASGGAWGLPAGKMDASDPDTKSAVQREITEETGLQLRDSRITHFDSWYVRDGTFDIEWHLFATQLNERPLIHINPDEHVEYRWIRLEEIDQMELIHDLPESLHLFYAS